MGPEPGPLRRMSREVVVTGLGAVTPIGGDVADTWEGLLAGRSGAAEELFFENDAAR